MKNELRTLLREKIFQLLIGIFLFMTLFSVYIGWSTRSTTIAIYNATVTILQSTGASQIPPNPIDGVSPLMVFSNLVIYILLVGALFSIVIGHRSFIKERKSGIIPLVFSRQVTKNQYVVGKLFGIEIMLTVIVVIAFLVSLFSALIIPTLHLSGAELIRLIWLYVDALLYLSLFAGLSFFFAIRMKTESAALFAPIMCWITAVFVLPELATGQNPVALLNPVTLSQASVIPNSFFEITHIVVAPFSVGQFFTGSAFNLLAGSSAIVVSLIGLLAYTIIVGIGSMYSVRSYIVTSDIIS